MNTFVVESEIVRIPAQVTDLDSFRRWAQSDDFPDTWGHSEISLEYR